MARYTSEHKREALRSHSEVIVEHAATRFRRDGIASVGLRRLMADAGLTHGTFYHHSALREELIAEALDQATQTNLRDFREVVDRASEDHKLKVLVGTYLHIAHRDHMDIGCTASALAPEIARETIAAR